MKKQILTGCTAVLLALTAAQGISAAAEDSASVYVTIANAGKLAVVHEEVTVTDLDGDGALTVADALTAAHEQCFEGGATAGFQLVDSKWGKSIAKLWGVENGGSYSYLVNNVFSMSPTDPVKDGDTVYAGVMQNTAANFDTYTYFDPAEAEVGTREAFTLTLNEAGWDESYNQIAKPLSGAVLTINGMETTLVTDADGKVTVTLDDAGIAQISATCADHVIFPPLALITAADISYPPETDTTAPADSTKASEDSTTASVSESSATDSTAASGGNSGAAADGGNQPAPKAGDSAPAALAVTAVLTLGAAYVLRRRHAE